MSDLGQAYVQIIPKATGISKKIGDLLTPGSREAGESAGASIASGIKKAIVAAGIGTAVIGTIKSAVDEGAKLQQSYGGLETIYGDAADAAKDYAKQAAQAGISANDYAEQAVSFGASLKQAFGGDTAKAVDAANTAIMDMTDNAAKMGTPIEAIQNAYQGFAKQNYTMLDNLKLGYGGTKTEMERLLADAEKIRVQILLRYGFQFGFRNVQFLEEIPPAFYVFLTQPGSCASEFLAVTAGRCKTLIGIVHFL